MTKYASAHDLLEALLRHEVPDETSLLGFLTSPAAREGLHLDFKHADELNKAKKDRSFTVRKYVAAFANSDGGVLAIGVEDKTKTLVPITRAHADKVGGDVTGWVARVVADLVGYLGLPPRIELVEVRGGAVLLVAVARAPALVPLHHDGQVKHFFRIDDDARAAPASLVADLVLGRRRAPFLTVEPVPCEVKTEKKTSSRSARLDSAAFDGLEVRRSTTSREAVITKPSFGVTNDSLVSSPMTRAGLIAWTFVETEEAEAPPLSSDLRARIEIKDLSGEDSLVHKLQHFPLTWSGEPMNIERALMPDPRSPTKYKVTGLVHRFVTMRPFDIANLCLDGDGWIFEASPKHQCSAALYLLPEGGEPLWYEVRVDPYGQRSRNKAGHPVGPIPPSITPSVRRVVGRRPLVSLRAAEPSPANVETEGNDAW